MGNELINNYKKSLDQLVVAKNEAATKEYRLLLGQTMEAVQKEAGKAAFKKKAPKYALDAASNKDPGADPTIELFDQAFQVGQVAYMSLSTIFGIIVIGDGSICLHP